MVRYRLVPATVVVAAPSWVMFLAKGGRGMPLSAGILTAVLGANLALTRRVPAAKRAVVRRVQRYIINPVVRIALTLQLPLGYSLLETAGRRTGRPRRTPVGEGRVGDSFWIVAEHGRHAAYVQNLLHDPRVRVRVRQGLRTVWREGTATIVEGDDPYDRQRQLCRWHPLRALNAAIVRVMGTDLLSVRIDLTV